MDPAVDHGDRELHHGMVAGGRRSHLHRALAPKDATMTTENAARRIATVGLLTGVLALLAVPASAAAGTTERVSVDSAGNQENGFQGPGLRTSTSRSAPTAASSRSPRAPRT